MSSTIKVFGISNITFPAEEFVFKLRHIKIKAETYSTSNIMYQEAKMIVPSVFHIQANHKN